MSTLSDSEKESFLAVLLRLARADEVSTVERDRLQPTLQWVKVPDQSLLNSMQRADDTATSLQELVGELRMGESGLLLFRECCAVAWVDGIKTPTESAFLDELASLIGLSDNARAVIDSPLSCSPEGERRFLELLRGTSSMLTEEEVQ